MAYKILVLKGDGIGPEVVGEALQVLKVVARNAALDLEFKEGTAGGPAVGPFRPPPPPDGPQQGQGRDPLPFRPGGGPQWGRPQARQRPRHGALTLAPGP